MQVELSSPFPFRLILFYTLDFPSRSLDRNRKASSARTSSHEFTQSYRCILHHPSSSSSPSENVAQFTLHSINRSVDLWIWAVQAWLMMVPAAPVTNSISSSSRLWPRATWFRWSTWQSYSLQEVLSPPCSRPPTTSLWFWGPLGGLRSSASTSALSPWDCHYKRYGLAGAALALCFQYYVTRRWLPPAIKVRSSASGGLAWALPESRVNHFARHAPEVQDGRKDAR